MVLYYVYIEIIIHEYEIDVLVARDAGLEVPAPLHEGCIVLLYLLAGSLLSAD